MASWCADQMSGGVSRREVAMFGIDDQEEHRPLGMTLLTGLYLFLFIVSLSSYGNPFPFLGAIRVGFVAQFLVFCDSLICLYLFLGIMKRQSLTWYLVIAYNVFEVFNTIINLHFINMADLERFLGSPVSREGLLSNNLLASLAVLLLTYYVYRSRSYFTNKRMYLF